MNYWSSTLTEKWLKEDVILKKLIQSYEEENGKLIKLFKIPITKFLDVWMRIFDTYLGYSIMLLELGDKIKAKLPSNKKC